MGREQILRTMYSGEERGWWFVSWGIIKDLFTPWGDEECCYRQNNSLYMVLNIYILSTPNFWSGNDIGM